MGRAMLSKSLIQFSVDGPGCVHFWLFDLRPNYRGGNEDKYSQGCILSPCLFNLYAEYIMQNGGLGEEQPRIKNARRNINNLRYTDDITLMAESEEELKSLLMKVKEESGKAGLRLNIQKTKIIASSPITAWQRDGEAMETVTDFILGGSKITAEKAEEPEIMYGCENWTIKKVKCQRIVAFELWCWETLLRVPWTARRPNQSILKEISPACSLVGLILKLKLQHFGRLM